MKQVIYAALASALQKLGVENAAPSVEYPAMLEHGDYASGAALQYAKQLDSNPRSLAEKIVDELGAIDGVEKIDIAGPGFINFYLTQQAFAAAVEQARATDMWGSNATMHGKEILIEYTSPNLFKPLHVGNLVGNVIGESASRLFQFSGAEVRRINYPSDIGLTVAKGVWGLSQLGSDPSDIVALGEAYRKGNEAYEHDEAAKKEIDAVNVALYEGTDAELNRLREIGVATSKAHLDELCRKLGTTFDHVLFESDAAPIGKQIVLDTPAVFPESDGARIFHGSHTRVFLTSKGLPTYEAKDLGNFVLKQKQFPNWDTYLVVTGVEQKEYFAVLYEAIRALFPQTAQKNLLHIATGFLTLTTGKMSSRLGNVLTGESLFADLADAAKERAAETRTSNIDELAEQIGVAALKYQILKQSTGKNIVFDKERALSLEGDSGPYLQYAYARTLSLMENAKAAKQTQKDSEDERGTGGAFELKRKLMAFPDIVERATKELEPHLVTTYLMELTSIFSRWYATERLIVDGAIAADRAAIIEALSRTLKNGLWILGIPAPEKM